MGLMNCLSVNKMGNRSLQAFRFHYVDDDDYAYDVYICVCSVPHEQAVCSELGLLLWHLACSSSIVKCGTSAKYNFHSTSTSKKSSGVLLAQVLLHMKIGVGCV